MVDTGNDVAFDSDALLDWSSRVFAAAGMPVSDAKTAADLLVRTSLRGIDTHGMRGALSITGLVDHAPISSVQGAEADVLSGITFGGSPQRVYLAFAAMPDGGGEALVVVALYDENRVEIRVLRGGSQPLYAIFALAET